MASFRGQFEDAGFIIQVLSRVLTQLIDVNQKSNTKQHFVTKFQSSYAPGISILGYLERINKYAKCSPNCFIVALIYIDRLIEIRNIVLTSLNVHRILITSVLISTKVFDDEFYKNAYYAKLGGVSTTELNSLELEFLSLVNFNLFVSTDTFEKYQNELRSFVSVSPTLSSALSVSIPSYSHERSGSMHPVSGQQMTPLEAYDTSNTGLFAPSTRPHPLDKAAPPLCVSSTSSFFSSSDDCGPTHSLAAPSCSRQMSYGMDCGLPEFDTGNAGGCQQVGHHQPSMPCPPPVPLLMQTNSAPPPFSSCFGMDASSYSGPFSTSQQGNGLCVDHLPSQWSAGVALGVAHSHQSYPPCSQQSFFAPPPQRAHQAPPYSGHGGGATGQGFRHVVFYPPPTTTPTSVADAFHPSNRFPSPAPYYDCTASPHIPRQQLAPMSSHYQTPHSACRVTAPPPIQQPHFHYSQQRHLHHHQHQQASPASFPSHMHMRYGGVSQQLQPPYPFGQGAVSSPPANSPSASDYQFPVAVRSS